MNAVLTYFLYLVSTKIYSVRYLLFVQLNLKTNQAATSVNTENLIPSIRQQLEELIGELSRLEGSIHEKQHLQQPTIVNTNIIKPTFKNSDYRSGDQSVISGKKSEGNYPDW